jgi:glyoxylase-like metal-dependent hydrolase (beta-lactamase superfamily II)
MAFTKTKKIAFSVIILLLITIAVAAVYVYPVFKMFTSGETIVLSPSVTVYTGKGGNSGIIEGTKQVLVVDTKMGGGAKELHEAALAKNKPVLIVNTHYHPDHTSGNDLYENATIMAGNYGKDNWVKVNGEKNLPDEWLSESKEIDLGGKSVTVTYLGNAHTSNDLAVFVPEEKVVFMGDVFSFKVHPVLADENVNVDNWIKVLRQYQQNPGIETVVPGHGNIAKRQDLGLLTEYFISIKEKINDPAGLRELEEKYSSWFSIPFFSGTKKTVEYIRKHP